MELVPEMVDGAVVLNLVVDSGGVDTRAGADVGVAVHNWLVTTELNYVIVDLQDEKDVPEVFIVELLQLRKRLRIPFLFAGVMERPKQVLQQYSYTPQLYPVFVTPEDAIEYMRRHHAPLLASGLEMVRFGEALQVSRPRHLFRVGMEGAEDVETEEDLDD